MQVSALLDDEEKIEFQEKLYGYFETGFLFENFLKKYLLKLGLDEVEVTQATRDNGVDLRAIRRGIGDFYDLDSIEYLIQAKRYAPNNKISVKMIHQLKGVVPDNKKGMFITTSDYTQPALKEALSSARRPAIVPINGINLVTSCIDNEIGFYYKPVFSKDALDEMLGSKIEEDKKKSISIPKEFTENDSIGVVEKMITANDVRARIISVPSSIMRKLDVKCNEIKLYVNDDKQYDVSINKGRNYFARVTTLFKDFGLITSSKSIIPKVCKWLFDEKENVVKLYIE